MDEDRERLSLNDRVSAISLQEALPAQGRNTQGHGAMECHVSEERVFDAYLVLLLLGS